MEIVFFTHPSFLNHQSMPRFSQMLVNGMKERNHNVVTINPRPIFFNIPFPKSLKKWLGYIDQYIVFPIEIKRKLKQFDNTTLFVFCDNALGPWVPLVKNNSHVIHCHDFIAQFSALNLIVENPISWTGRLYQKFIRNGYSKGKNFISVSQKTKSDLHFMLGKQPTLSEVVYNGLNQKFDLISPSTARRELGAALDLNLEEGYILHVGGNQWYKNRKGVIEIYEAWRSLNDQNLPLLLIGEEADVNLLESKSLSKFKDDIHFVSNLADEIVRLAYSGASIFLFPSIAEGFGWPIAEAMASGCPVITTNEAPMTEVAGNCGFLIPKYPQLEMERKKWANQAARIIVEITKLSPEKNAKVVLAGLKNAERFNTEKAMDKIESIYERILKEN